MNTEYDIELVEKYFDRELTEEEDRLITQRLETDQEFKALFEQEKILIQSIRLSELEQDLHRLKELEKNLSGDGQTGDGPSFHVKPWYYAVAAAVALLATLSVWQLPQRANPEQLFEAYFTPARNVYEPRVRGTDPAAQRAAAFQAYEWGNYKLAVDQFTALLKEKQEPGMLLLNGNANLMLGNVQAAEENFLALIRDFNELDDAGRWYLGLCYLKDGETNRAKEVLGELAKGEGLYATKATELLEKVN